MTSEISEAGPAQDAASFDPGLRIMGLETVALRVPLARTYHGSAYRMTHRSTLIVRIFTESGVMGEAYVGDEDGALSKLIEIVDEEIAPRVLGENILSIERIWELARPATFDILRDRRLGLVASAGIDAAAWDAIGKHVQKPLWLLWGGYRASLPLISIGGYYLPGADIKKEVEERRLSGVAGMKLKVGGLTPAEDAKRFIAARQAAGEDFVLIADANQAWSPREAIEFAHLVADHDLYWFEEPCRWHNDRRALRDVRHATGVRVCAGQSELSASGCRDLMEMGAIDICNFDASWSGGPTEWRRAAAIAHSYDVAMAHHEEPQLAAHLLAAIPHGTYLECFDHERDPVWWNLVSNRPLVRDGHVALPARPGLGWELDQDYIERYRVPVR